MQIKKIHIQNFKSLVDFELDSPRQFCAFVGPNASGKSNIFEALEFVNYVTKYSINARTFFGGLDDILSFNKKEIDAPKGRIDMRLNYTFSDEIQIGFDLRFSKNKVGEFIIDIIKNNYFPQLSSQIFDENEIDQKSDYSEEKKVKAFDINRLFISNFSRIFVGKSELVRINSESQKLKSDASNLPQIIGQIFQDDNKSEDFIEWLRILIPEFENLEIKQSNIDGSYDFFVYEKGSSKPFPRRLLSDGTMNILSIMAAVYQSNEPQFLCIEEPENGLHPYAIELLVDFFREKCETEGQHIWLNTHSQTLVRAMNIDELVLVNKMDGKTQAKRVENMEGIDIKTDEAWLTNALGGGVLWSK